MKTLATLTTRQLITASLALGCTLSVAPWTQAQNDRPYATVEMRNSPDTDDIEDETFARELRQQLYVQARNMEGDEFADEWYLFIDARPIQRDQDAEGRGWQRIVRSQNVPLDPDERIEGNRLMDDDTVQALQDWLDDLGDYEYVDTQVQEMDGLQQQEDIDFPSNDDGLVAVRFTIVPRGDESAPTEALVVYLDRQGRQNVNNNNNNNNNRANNRNNPPSPSAGNASRNAAATVTLTSGLPVGLELDAQGLTRRIANRISATTHFRGNANSTTRGDWRFWVQSRDADGQGWQEVYHSDDIEVNANDELGQDELVDRDLREALDEFAGNRTWEVVGTSVLRGDGLRPEGELEWPGGDRVTALRFSLVPAGEQTAANDSLVVFLRPTRGSD